MFFFDKTKTQLEERYRRVPRGAKEKRDWYDMSRIVVKNNPVLFRYSAPRFYVSYSIVYPGSHLQYRTLTIFNKIYLGKKRASHDSIALQL